MKDLLLDMKAQGEQAKTLGQHELDLSVLGERLAWRQRDSQRGLPSQSPASSAKKSEQGKRNPGEPHKAQFAIGTDRFLPDFAAPFDNNQAERDLCMSHPCSKKSLAAPVPSRASSCFVTFAALSRPYDNKELTCSRADSFRSSYPSPFSRSF